MNISFLQSVPLLRLTGFIGLFSVFSFQVKSQDTIPPVINCTGGYWLSYYATKLWTSDLLLNVSDDVTPFEQLQIGIKKSGTGTDFPTQEFIQYVCWEQGIQYPQLWVKDLAGNTSFCESYLLIEERYGVCESSGGMFGYTKTENDQAIEDVIIHFSGNNALFPSFKNMTTTNNSGLFTDNGVSRFLFDTMTPELNNDPLNGVNTWDLVQISRHILGLQPLSSPYKLIAADVNKSGTVTTFDIVELRKLLLGSYSTFQNNNSWRFVDKTQVFSNQENPFADTIRESVHATPQFPGDGFHLYDFVGIKIGDVDNTAVPNNLLSPDDRNAPFTAFNITRNDAKHWLVNKGETVELTFSCPHTLSGYQMTLETDGIQPSEVVPGEGMSNDNFGVFDHAVTTVFEQGNTPFSIRFTAEESGDLRDMIHVSSRITPAMAFGQNGEKMQVNLRFEGEKSSISPNPWSEHTRISYYTPEPTTATLKVFDMAGRLVYTTTNNVEKGEQSFELNSAQVPASGILIYEITTDNGVISGKMNKH